MKVVNKCEERKETREFDFAKRRSDYTLTRESFYIIFHEKPVNNITIYISCGELCTHTEDN